ncbi:MAG: hypothetical protein COA71_03140 [SAR86 cluster bacterium]|uniref:YtkA-like domain-containing protein n=1 Tax=SAR86 cluster bacterium TaxID=2030880 RepID=A0A2A5CFH4_9GAMM|nr:MAG: hypothetical protein COA71_03140 [SAR86 cluster bacterium]
MKIILSKILQITLLLSTFATSSVSAQEEVAPGVWLSRGGSYRLSYSTQYFPVPAQIPHEWILYILDGNRRPIENAVIEIHGYHPESREILPRMTYISSHLGRGAYQVQNMFFHQPGDWELNIVITNGSKVDAVLIPISI